MAFEEYGASPAVDTWVTLGGINRKTGKANPTEIKGHYLGVTSQPSTFDEGKEKVTIMLRTADGKKTGVNVSANLKIKLERAEKEYRERNGSAPGGVNTWIQFLGEQPSKKGNPMKLFSVKFDKDNRIDVGLDNAKQAVKEDDDGDFAADYTAKSFDNTDDEVFEADEDPDQAQIAALAAAERKAKIQALLKRK